MATFTTNYNLRKPATSDFVTVSTDINANMDTIDTQIKNRETEIDALEAVINHRCRAYKSDLATQTITTSTNTTVTLGAASYDPSSMFDNVNDEIDIPATGVYGITANVHWEDASSGTTRALVILVNGKAVASGFASDQTGIANYISNATATYTGYLAQNDVVKMEVWHNEGSNKSLEGYEPPTGSRTGCNLEVVRLA